jgi:hypothetical protein
MIRHEATSSAQEARVVAGGNRRLRRLVELVGPVPIYDSVDDACVSRGRLSLVRWVPRFPRIRQTRCTV